MALNCSPLFPPTAAPAVGPPAWLNPAAIMAQCATRLTELIPADLPVTQIAAPDPKRVMIGFASRDGAAFYISPSTNVAKFGWTMLGGTPARDTWFDVFTFGTLVNGAWYTEPNAGVSLLVIEVYRTF